MTNKKMTKKEMFAMVMEVLELVECNCKEEMLNFLRHEIDLLERKSSSPKKTASQEENERIMVLLTESLAEVGKPVTISELWEKVPRTKKYSNQKISALFRKMIEEGTVVKTIDKKKSYFSLAE